MKDKENKSFEEWQKELNLSSNSQKVATALAACVMAFVTKPEKDRQSLEVFADVMTKGCSAIRGSVIIETLMKVSNDGKDFSIPNDGERFKERVSMASTLR